jgi:uncharacterized protein YjdB
MKKFVLIGIGLAILFAGCDNGTTSTPDSGTPVDGLELTPTTLSLEPGATATLSATVTPADANQAVTWSSSDTGVATVSDGVVTAVGAGTATITAATKGKDYYGDYLTADCAVTVQTEDVFSYHWDFSANPAGWTAENASNSSSDADYGNGMTLLALSGSTNIDNDSGSGRSMGIYLERGEQSIGGTELSATACALRVNGKGTFAKITGIQGPYRVTITYSLPSSSNTDSRYPIVKTGNITHNGDGSLSKPPASGASGAWMLETTYTGTDAPDIYLKANDGIYIHDVYLASIAATPVTALTLTPATLSLVENDTGNLTAAVTPADADQGVLWSSSDETIATVADGVVTAVAPGSATITAATRGKNSGYQPIQQTCAVTVSARSIISFTISDAALTLAIDGFATLSTTIEPSNANQGVTWSSSDTAVATVVDGLVTAISQGTATITAGTVGKDSTGNSVTATCTVTVQASAPPVESLTLNYDTLTLNLGGSEVTLTATVAPVGAVQEVSWEVTSNTGNIISFNETTHAVSPLALGTAEITVTTAGNAVGGQPIVKTCAITVQRPPVSGVTLNKTATTLAAQATETLSATVAPTQAEQGVTWSSSDTNVATVSTEGLVTAIAAGTAVIKAASTANSEKYAECTVTVPGAGELWWRAERTVNVTNAQSLWDGKLNPTSDMNAGNTTKTIEGEDFNAYVASSATNGVINGTGSGFAFTPDVNGTLTVYVCDLGNGKELVIIEDGETDKTAGPLYYKNESGASADIAKSAAVTAGQKYYISGLGTKARYLGLHFEPGE